MCDQDDDCGDHSDEDGCRKYSKVQSEKTTLKNPPHLFPKKLAHLIILKVEKGTTLIRMYEFEHLKHF